MVNNVSKPPLCTAGCCSVFGVRACVCVCVCLMFGCVSGWSWFIANITSTQGGGGWRRWEWKEKKIKGETRDGGRRGGGDGGWERVTECGGMGENEAGGGAQNTGWSSQSSKVRTPREGERENEAERDRDEGWRLLQSHPWLRSM